MSCVCVSYAKCASEITCTESHLQVLQCLSEVNSGASGKENRTIVRCPIF